MPLTRSIQRLTDFLITLLLWSYFLFGSIVFFFLLYMPAYLFARKSCHGFSEANPPAYEKLFYIDKVACSPHKICNSKRSPGNPFICNCL